MLSECRHPSFRNRNSTDPVDVVRVKSYVDSLLNSTRIPVRVSGNKLNFVPDRITDRSYLRVQKRPKSEIVKAVYPYRAPCTHLPVWPIYFAAVTKNLTHYSILFSWLYRILRSHCCCRKRRSGSLIRISL